MDQAEFLKLRENCRVRLAEYTTQARRTCDMLSKCEALPLIQEIRTGLQNQRALEHVAYATYQEVRARLFDLAGVGYSE